jgi:hypothetical protein
MRGCLTFLLFVAILVGAIAWVGAATAGSAGITAALAASGLSGTDTKVTVTANPPLELVSLHADSVRVQTKDAQWNDLRAATLDLTLDDVSLGSRSFASIKGRLTGVQMTSAGTTLSSGLVTLTGSSTKATATISVAPGAVSALAMDAAERTTGTRPSKVTLSPPDKLALIVGGTAVAGRLAIDSGGALVALVQGVGTVQLLAPDARNPFTFTSVTVTPDGGLTLGARVDLGSLTG